MISDIIHPKYPFHFLVDNLFANITLFNFLRERGYNVTGTLREDRIITTCPLISTKAMTKAERGFYVLSLEKDHEVCILCCFGAKPVG